MAVAPVSSPWGRVLAARGAAPVLAAAAVAGVAGYVIGVLVPWAVSATTYAAFSLVWSTQFLTVAALSGVQQEVGRATSPAGSTLTRDPAAGLAQAFRFAQVLAAVVAVATALVAALLVRRGVLPGSSVLPLTVAATAFGVVAVVTGLLYGLGRTGVVALEVSCEWTLRCVLVAAVLAAGGGLAVLLWAVALPTLLALLVVVPVLRRALGEGLRLDVPPGRLTRNVLLAVATSIASGALISGFPVLMASLTDAAHDPRLPGINLAIMLIRSPIVIAVVALQAFLVVRFRDARRSAELMWRVQGALLVVTAVATIVIALGAPPVLDRFGTSYHLSAGFLAGLVVASGLLGCLNVSGAFVLARAQHGFYLTGWVLAAASAVVVLLLPTGDLEVRVIGALLVAPVLGLIVHLGAIVRPR